MNVTLYRRERHRQAAAGRREGDGRRPRRRRCSGLAGPRCPTPWCRSTHWAAVAASWRETWDESRQEGSVAFEQEAVRAALAAWRAGRFELLDNHLVLAREDTAGPVLDLGPCVGRAHWVVLVPEQEPGQQAAGCGTALGSRRHGPGGRAWTR